MNAPLVAVAVGMTVGVLAANFKTAVVWIIKFTRRSQVKL